MSDVAVTTQIGTFVFDVVTEESHHSELKVTDNPVESGSQISDHAILTPRPIEFSGIMVDFDASDTLFNQIAEENYVREPDFIDSVPIPGLKNMTTQAVSLANRVIDQVASAASSVVGGASGQRALAPWLPGLTSDSTDLSSSDQRVSDALKALRSIQQSAEPISITTQTASYDQCLILNVDVKFTRTGSAEFSLKCREIFITTTQTASGLKVPSQSKTGGRTTKQAAKSVDKGNGSLSKTDGESLPDNVKEAFNW
ncbi:phage baseplate protein [Erwinia amylovora]